MLAIRPPYECPPIAAPGCSSSDVRNTSIARSLFDFGRSSAVAAMPCFASSVTHGRIESAVPEAPWPRRSREPAGCSGARRVLTATSTLLAFEDLERRRLGGVRRRRRPSRQPAGAHQGSAEQDAAATPEGKSSVQAIQRSQDRSAESH